MRAERLPTRTEPRSDVACRQGSVLSIFELGKPSIRLFERDMQAGHLIFVPGTNAVLSEYLSLFFAFNVFAYCIKHHSVRCAMTCIGKAFNTVFDRLIDFKCSRMNCGSAHNAPIFKIQSNTLDHYIIELARMLEKRCLIRFCRSRE